MIVNIEKRHVFLIVGVLVFFGGLFFVNAFGTSVPATFGHSSAEIIVDDAFCNRITGHGCGVDVDTDTSAVTECLDDEFLDGDGSCLTAEEIVGAVGGGSLSCVIESLSGNPGFTLTVNCPSGYTVTGGGEIPDPDGGTIGSSYPYDNGWICSSPRTWMNRGTCYAVCCKIV